MNEQLKKLVEEAGFEWELNTYWNSPDGWWKAESADLERFVELVRKDHLEEISGHTLRMVVKAVMHERDACAKLCDEREEANLYGIKECANAIRERSINSIFCSSSYPIINEER